MEGPPERHDVGEGHGDDGGHEGEEDAQPRAEELQDGTDVAAEARYDEVEPLVNLVVVMLLGDSVAGVTSGADGVAVVVVGDMVRREMQNSYEADVRGVEGDEPDSKALRDANV